jgi:predicted MPP superfamily phosphohydrolase
MSSGRGRHNSRTRKMMMAAFDASLLHGVVAGWSYRLGLHGKFSVTTQEIRVAAGKRLPKPLVVGFASDFHAGPTTHPALFATLIEELKARRPDVFLLGGDYVSCEARYVDALTDCLARYAPPLGKYAVLGNHDLWTDDEYISRRLTAAGVEVLVNRSVSLPAPFDGVSICGIDDPWTGSADVAKSFEGANPIRIFLTHSPDGLLLLNNEQFDLALAGHTHGGQIARRDGTSIITAGGPLSRIYGRGRFEIPGHGPLIVSLGVGCSSIPVRINADPELIICTLRPDTSI